MPQIVVNTIMKEIVRRNLKNSIFSTAPFHFMNMNQDYIHSSLQKLPEMKIIMIIINSLPSLGSELGTTQL
jgi:hypothetical protein